MEPEQSEALKQAAAEALGGSPDGIRERVRDLTLAALRERRFDLAAVKAVLGDVTEGVSLGAEQKGAEVRQALESAVHGLDEALGKTAHATQLAWSELASKGLAVGETEWRSGLEALRKLEGELVSSLSAAAERAGPQVKTALQDIAAHATRTGTDTGAAVGRTLATFGQTVADAAAQVTQNSLEAAKAVSERLAEATSGFLAGVSEAMRPRDPGDKR